MLKLYQFPVSHFCEIARWALDYKHIEHEQVTLLPGLHVRKVRKLADRSSVPILCNGETVVQGASQIIDYLDLNFPQNQLTPTDELDQARAREWEEYAHAGLGPQVRLVIYHIMLDYPEIIRPLFTQNGPWYGSILMQGMYPSLQKKMRQYMGINDETAAASNQEILKTVSTLANHYNDNEFMIGERFSRADLTAAALLAPIVMPDGYGVSWPGELPERMQEFIDQFDGQLSWIERFYAQFR